MEIYYKSIRYIFFIMLSIASGSGLASPFFTITPITPITAGTRAAPQLLVFGQTIVATYQVRNTSGITLSDIQLDLRTLPAGKTVIQDTKSHTFADQCGAIFMLQNNQSCTLRLLVTGPVNQSMQTYGTPGICYGAYSACSQPTKANRLQVTLTNDAPLITINSIQLGQMAGDTAASEFSTEITFTNGAHQLSNWQFGFYMPRTFAALTSSTQAINPRLKMQICSVTDPTDCADLLLQQAKTILQNDISTGNTTILAPVSTFFLMPKTQYIIKLLHNNQWNPGNYSALPQNFFMANVGLVSNIPTVASDYHLLNYRADEVTQAVSRHIDTNWQNSNTTSSPLSVIPQPQSFTAGTGSYTLSDNLVIHNGLNNDNTVADLLVAALNSDLNLMASVDNNVEARTGIGIKKIPNAEPINNNLEGYQIQVSNNGITIYALNNTGVFYALQTLRQLWNQSKVLPNGIITDYPRFKYRGVLLDVARHFFNIAEIEKLIDIVAAHKLNTLHIHFSDDEGSRLGLTDYYPILASKANTRGYGFNTMALMFIQANLDITNLDPAADPYPYVDTKYIGTYHELDLKNLIAYANARGITIIPEIDLPGHARALIKAFPNEMVDPNDQSQFISVQGYNDDVLPVCTYNTNSSVGAAFTPLINNLITKAAELFNGQTTLYAVNNEVSVGGDEVSSGAWTQDPSCTGTWSSLSALEKSHKFFALLAASNSNLKFSGWQQYVQNDDASLGENIVPSTQAAHVWVWNTSGAHAGVAQAINLAQSGYPVVLAFADQTYFDLAYTPEITEPGFTWATAFSDTQSALSSAISANSVLAGLTTPQQHYITGIEGTLWSENLASYDHMVYMALPKMAGLAEAAWSNPAATTADNQSNWHDLANRLGCGKTGFLAYLDKLYSVKYRGYPNGIALEVPVIACPATQK